MHIVFWGFFGGFFWGGGIISVLDFDLAFKGKLVGFSTKGVYLSFRVCH